MLTSAQFGRQFSRHFGQEKTFRRERRTGTSALGFLNQGSWGSGDDLAPSLEPTNSIRTHTQSAGPTRKGVTSTLIRTLRSDDLTAAKTSLKKRIRVLSVFIAIVPTHFVKIDVGEPSRSWISKKHIQWNEEMIVAENAIYAIA